MKIPLALAFALLVWGCGSSPAANDAANNAANSTGAPKNTPTDPKKMDVSNATNASVGDFELTLVSGDRVPFSKFAGKTVLLDFWASWCGPCKEISPILNEFHKKYEKDGLVVIGVNTFEDQSGGKSALAMSIKAAQDYEKAHPGTYLQAVYGDKLADAWQIAGLPTLVLIGPSGVVVRTVTGSDPEGLAQIESDIKRLTGKV